MFLAIFFACSPQPSTEPVAAGPGYSVQGTLPEGIDVEALVADLPTTGFAVVGTPGSEEMAVVTRTDEAAKLASGWFSSVGAVCIDCGDPTCSSFQRTVRVGLTRNSGPNGETFEIQSMRTSFNFAAQVSTPDAWKQAIGATRPIDTLGTLSTCSAFAHKFEILTRKPDTGAGGSGCACGSGHTGTPGGSGTWVFPGTGDTGTLLPN